AQVDIEVEDIDFGDVYISESSTAQPVVISNEGDDPLTISEWFFIDNNFSVAQTILTDASGNSVDLIQTTNELGAGDDIEIPSQGYLTLQLIFSPDDLGFFDDIFHLATDDPNNQLLTVPLTGKGLSQAAITILEDSGEFENDDQLDLGRIVMGQTGTESFIITNQGTTPLTIFRVWEEDGNTEINISPQLKNEVLLPDGQVVITVTYTPTDPDNNLEVEDLDTRIRISSDDPIWSENKSYLIDLVGQAVPQVPIISVTETSNTANDNRLEFGTLEVGQQNSLTFEIQNIGGADLILESFVVDELITPFFTVPALTADPDDNITLQPDQIQTVSVNFDPDFSGNFSQSLLIRSNNLDQASDIYELTLIASSVELVLEVEDSYQDPGDYFIDFSVVPENQSVQQTISLTNHGTTSLNVNWTEIEDPGGVYTLDPATATNLDLDPGETEVITVTFTPQDNTSFNGTVWITSPTLGEEWFISLLGVGAAPGEGSITDDQTSSPHGVIDFPLLTAKYETATHSFAITNTGASDLVIEGILITEPWQSISPDELEDIEKQTAPFILDISGGNVSDAGRLDPDEAGDDITLLPTVGQLTVPVTFAPQTIYSDATWYISILTNDPTGNNPIVTYVELTGESEYPMEAGGQFVNKLTFPVDFSGDNWVTVKLSGPGYGLVILKNGTASGSEVKRIELFDTTEKSSLTMFSNQTTHLGQIVGGDMKNVILKNVIVDGESADGAAIVLDRLYGKLTMAGLSDGADININGQGSKGVKLDLGPVGDNSDVYVNGDIEKFNAAEFGDGTIEATNIKTFKVNGGDFDATVRVDENINNVSLKGYNIGGSFIVQGDLNKFNASNALFTGAIRADNIGKAAINSLLNADISVKNVLNSLKVQIDSEDSRILAGYDLGSDGRLGGINSAADTPNPGGHINNININRVFDGSVIASGVSPNDQGNFLDPTNDTATGSIGKVKFNFVQFNNSFTPFGVAAHTSIDRVLIGNTTIHPNDPAQMDFDVMLI
ncbi:MAG: choice-of-anchor D domain-containing protein, partial [Planctomycetes bacterium]|nr:choice-of-anchor D domain-containing protein [Planctomycetota bacterium]